MTDVGLCRLLTVCILSGFLIFKCWFVSQVLKLVSHDIHLMIQIAVLITNGRSDDPVDAAARLVADNGISLFAVGE